MTPTVRPRVIEFWTQRYDSFGIDVLVAHVIVALDVIEVHRIANSRNLIELAEIP